MNKNIHRSKTIAELHQGMGLEKPNHPLITIVNTEHLSYGEEIVGMRFCSDMYCIAHKDNGCGIDYGRNRYEFDEGSLLFTAPEQVFTVTKAQELNQSKGWMLYFHPDLIHNTPLGNAIDRYDFFNYESRVALQLSERELETLNSIVQLIQTEIDQNADNNNQQILVSSIELMLNYCLRFYQGQAAHDARLSDDVISRVETLLKEYYRNHDLTEAGPPTIQYLADKCYLSPQYLSDLLTKETGRSAKEHINDFLIDKAKHLLLSSEESISTIAYSLGFNYPHYFARLFKQKTGATPQQYRKEN